MSKIPNAFKNGKAFIGFLTAGDPTCEKTVEYILAMEVNRLMLRSGITNVELEIQ